MTPSVDAGRRRALGIALGSACLLAGGLALQAQNEPPVELRRAQVQGIPTLIAHPPEPRGRRLVIWLPGFSGTKEGTEPQLRALARAGFVALSFDPYQHGERRVESQDTLRRRVRGNIRCFFWPILARTAEEVPLMIDWAIRELGVNDRVGMGGTSMGGDISIAAAAVDHRIRVVSAVVATPDWMRPGSFEPPGEPDAAARADYDRRNPLTHLDAYRHRPYLAFQCGADDRQVPPDGAQRFVAALKPLYGPHADRLQVNLQPGKAHGFTPEMWTWSLEWFQKHLN